MIVLWKIADRNENAGMPAVYELVIWLKAPYRGVGIGRRALSLVLEQFWWEQLHFRHRAVGEAVFLRPFTIRTRFPAPAVAGSALSGPPTLWRNFFSNFAFRRPPLPVGDRSEYVDPEAPADAVLERHFLSRPLVPVRRRSSSSSRRPKQHRRDDRLIAIRAFADETTAIACAMIQSRLALPPS